MTTSTPTLEAPPEAIAETVSLPAAHTETTPHLLRRVLQDREALLEEIVTGRKLKLGGVALVALLFSALGGLAIGSATSPLQALAAAVKVPTISLLALITCFPAFFIFGLLQGSKVSLETSWRLFAVGLGMRGAVLAGLAPLLLFFSSVGTPYGGLLIGALLAFGLAEVGFLATLDKGIRKLRELNDDAFQPWLVRTWMVVDLMVTAQLAWSMRPLIRHPSVTEFQLFGGLGQNENMFFYFLEQLTRLFGA